MDEFVVDVNFEYGIPMLMLDIINSLTGFDIIGEIKKEFEPKQAIVRLNADNEEFTAFKNRIPDDLQDQVFDLFYELAEKPLANPDY
jgi:hypothetical protein